MPRFFIEGTPDGGFPAGEFFLGGEEGRHGALSLRLRPGESVVLCDGNGTDYPAEVLRAEKDGLWLQVGEARPNAAEPRTQVVVCQCLPKGDKLETVTQKAVELGAAAIWPVESARCVSRPDAKAAGKKRERLQKIALEAAKQSGRGVVPQVLPTAPLRQALETAAREGSILFCYEQGDASLREALHAAGEKLFLFVGPEGGFAPEEAALAKELGAAWLTLGPRILRTETAPLAALAAILYERGEMER